MGVVVVVVVFAVVVVVVGRQPTRLLHLLCCPFGAVSGSFNAAASATGARPLFRRETLGESFIPRLVVLVVLVLRAVLVVLVVLVLHYLQFQRSRISKRGASARLRDSNGRLHDANIR